MPTVTNFCGFNLKTGSLLIGYFELGISIIGMISSAVLFFFMDEMEHRAFFRNVTMIGFTVSALTFLAGFFLTNGINKVDRTQVKPWVVIKGIMLCFEVGVICFTSWILYIEHKREHPILMITLVFMVEIVVTGLTYFTMAVVRAYYKIMPRYQVV
ncbi:hypothetical protein ACFFRR_004339 [Megaselia abdita]